MPLFRTGNAKSPRNRPIRQSLRSHSQNAREYQRSLPSLTRSLGFKAVAHACQSNGLLPLPDVRVTPAISRKRLIAPPREMALCFSRNVTSSPVPQPAWHFQNHEPLFRQTEKELWRSSWKGHLADFFARSPRPHRAIKSGSGKMLFAFSIRLIARALPPSFSEPRSPTAFQSGRIAGAASPHGCFSYRAVAAERRLPMHLPVYCLGYTWLFTTNARALSSPRGALLFLCVFILC